MLWFFTRPGHTDFVQISGGQPVYEWTVPYDILKGGQPGAFRVISKTGTYAAGIVKEGMKGIAQNTVTDLAKGNQPTWSPKIVPVRNITPLEADYHRRTPDLLRMPSPGFRLESPATFR